MGRASRCSVSKLYLVDFWGNSDSEFLKKSMPRTGPATAAYKELDVKSLRWNCMVFFNETPRGDGLHICPLSRGPDGLEFWLQGTMLKVAPVSTKYLSFVFEKNESCIGWEMHRRGSRMCWIGRQTENV
jgi:hypothetical protein